MRILLRGSWRDGFLDYYRAPDEIRLEASAWRVLTPIEGAYFVRPRSLRMVWNYVWALGPRVVMRKILSRMREEGRNEKWLSAGYGRVLEAPPGGRFSTGEHVQFIAPFHPLCAERLTLPPLLLRPVDRQRVWGLKDRTIAFVRDEAPGPWTDLAAWSPFSGAPPIQVDAALDAAATLLARTDWAAGQHLPLSASRVRDRCESQSSRGRAKLRAVLVGYGNYAKTVMLPNIKRHLRVHVIHELDPTQLPNATAKDGPGLDTAPSPRLDEDFEVLLAAGYHHTHAPLAAEALREGRYAVVEKPLATSPAQFKVLLEAVRKHPRLFACFQRRYLPFNEMAREDLGVPPGGPVSYHAIVYEVPLPPQHWYAWPASGSRLLSNGCHWVDHFLYLNAWSEPCSCRAWKMRDGTITVAVELANGAAFTLALTEEGSERIGVRDHVELRAGDRTVTIDDGSRYYAESSERKLRQVRVSRLDAYRRMYRSICRRIAAAETGDSLRSVEVSTRLMLTLDQELRRP